MADMDARRDAHATLRYRHDRQMVSTRRSVVGARRADVPAVSRANRC